MLEYLKTVFIQVICVYLLQSIIFVFSLYTFTKTKIQKKEFILCTFIFMVGTYIIRLLPIYFGVHTLLSLILLMFLGFYILKLPVYSTIKATLFTTVILLVVEAANLFVLKMIFSENDFTNIIDNPISKAVTGIPTNIIFFIIIWLFYKHFTKVSVKKNEEIM